MKRKNILISLFALALLFLTATLFLREKEAPQNEIRSSVIAEIKSLDPVMANDTYSNRASSQIHEALYGYDHLKRPVELIPLLAEGMPEFTANGLTATIKIKKGIYFHDNEAFENGQGRELTAEDFVYSFKRLANPKIGSQGYWIFEGKIKGLNEWRAKLASNESQESDPVEGLQALDSHTLQIQLTQPYHQLAQVLAMTLTAPVPREVVEKYGLDFGNKPVGVGPFQFQSWTRGHKLVLTRHPRYFEKGLPKVDQVSIFEITEDQPRWLSLLNGDLDFSGIPKDNYDTSVVNGELIEDLQKQGFRLDVYDSSDVVYTAFNMEDPLLGKNKNLRRAIAHAFNNQLVIEKFYNYRAREAQSLIAPGLDGYDESYKNPYQTYDVEKAKKFLADAGYPNGQGLPPLTFSISNSDWDRQFSELFAQKMKEIGITIKIETSSWPQFSEKVKNRKAQIFSMAWTADYPDSQNLLQLLYSKNASPGPNGANFKNVEYDRLYEQALLLPRGPERTALYLKMRDIAVEEAPWIFHTHRRIFTIYHDRIKNMKMPQFHHNFLKHLEKEL